MRFVKQKNLYSCGPIAILNSLKWAGLKVSYKTHFNKIKKLSNCEKDGCDYNDIVKAIYKYKRIFNVFENHFISIKDIDLYLKDGASLILEYFYKDNNSIDGFSGHLVFIPGKWNTYFLVVNNYNEGSAIQLCSRRELKNMIKPKIIFGREPRAIILYRKDKQ